MHNCVSIKKVLKFLCTVFRLDKLWAYPLIGRTILSTHLVCSTDHHHGPKPLALMIYPFSPKRYLVFLPGGLEVLDGPELESILVGPRVGIEYASPEHVAAPWRFAIAGTPWISAPKNTLRPR